MFEVRVLDTAPVRGTAGPLMRAWIDERLSENLERKFRCSRPCSLVPRWLAEAGFRLDEGRGSFDVALPCAVDGDADVETELAGVVAREMWRGVWGEFAEEGEGWWEDEEILRECRERGTVLECRVMFAYRDEGEE